MYLRALLLSAKANLLEIHNATLVPGEGLYLS